jgi:hypothetical protein
MATITVLLSARCQPLAGVRLCPSEESTLACSETWKNQHPGQHPGGRPTPTGSLPPPGPKAQLLHVKPRMLGSLSPICGPTSPRASLYRSGPRAITAHRASVAELAPGEVCQKMEERLQEPVGEKGAVCDALSSKIPRVFVSVGFQHTTHSSTRWIPAPSLVPRMLNVATRYVSPQGVTWVTNTAKGTYVQTSRVALCVGTGKCLVASG